MNAKIMPSIMIYSIKYLLWCEFYKYIFNLRYILFRNVVMRYYF